MKITGGIKEIVNLAHDIAGSGTEVSLLAMWRTQNEVACAPIPLDYLSTSPIGIRRVILGLPRVMWKFGKLVSSRPKSTWMLTHYVTYALTPYIRLGSVWFFVQDLEWRFVPAGLRPLLKRFIIGRLRRGRVLSTNDYLTAELEKSQIPVTATIPIWASPAFAGRVDKPRDIDIVIIIRRGNHKRVDLARAFLALRESRAPWLRVAVITPNDEFLGEVPNTPETLILLRPSPEEMRDLYERTKLFLLFSEHEGFGLPPLEAMGSGCVPICRDAGGVRTYMRGDLLENLLPLTLTMPEIFNRVLSLLEDESRLAVQRKAARLIFDQGVELTENRLQKILADGIV